MVAQGVLLWDEVGLEMKRIGKGHTRISLLPLKMIDEVPVSFKLIPFNISL
jgi:hypothetical protein